MSPNQHLQEGFYSRYERSVRSEQPAWEAQAPFSSKHDPPLRVFACQDTPGCGAGPVPGLPPPVGTLDAENFWLSVVLGTAPQENIAINLKP